MQSPQHRTWIGPQGQRNDPGRRIASTGRRPTLLIKNAPCKAIEKRVAAAFGRAYNIQQGKERLSDAQV